MIHGIELVADNYDQIREYVDKAKDKHDSENEEGEAS